MTTNLPPMTFGELSRAWDRFPVVMTNAVLDANEGVLIGFWGQFRRQIPLKSRGPGSPERPSLKNARAWPITSQGNTLDTIQSTIATESEAAKLFEFGGTVRPKDGENIAIPIAAARTRTGGVKPYYSSPKKRRQLGDEFLFLFRGGKKYLHQLVPVKKRKRGRPRRDAGAVPMKPSESPYFLLVDKIDVRAQLGFYETWERFFPEAVVRWRHNVEAAVFLLLGKPLSPRHRRWLERRGGKLGLVNANAS